MSTAANLCTSQKLKAAGKKAFKKSNCFSKAVNKGANVDPGCTCGEDTKLNDAFTKAETQVPPACINGTADAGLIGGAVDASVTDLVDELTAVGVTTTTTSTSTTIPCNCGTPDPTRLSFTTVTGAGSTGNVLDPSGAPLKTLGAGKLYTGGGGSALPPSTIPDYGTSFTKVTLCNGTDLTLTATTQT